MKGIHGSKSADSPELPIRNKRPREDSSPTGPPKGAKADDLSRGGTEIKLPMMKKVILNTLRLVITEVIKNTLVM